MADLITEELTKDDYARIAQIGKTPELANEAWEKYKKKGGDNWRNWRNFAEYGKTPEIANEAWKKYKINDGNEWGYFAKYGKTEEIRSDARERLNRINKYI